MKIPKLLNKYWISVIVLFVLLAFVDQYNFRAHYKLMKELRDLKNQKAFFLEEIEQDSTAFHNLFESDDNLEKFAREKYKMKKPNEDIFIIIEEE
ncbi:MAG: septum formation initiator family protein [Bacteroidales bacterium]|nr:septum formation initiator family protein [Bacteroidales bacterium]